MDSQLQKKLSQISQLKDKKQALTELSKLFESSDSSAENQAEILLQRGKTFFSLHQYNQGIDAVSKARDTAKQQALSLLVRVFAVV